jgi:hypothetical protein
MTNAEMVLKATAGNQEAARFLETIVGILHFWDDLVDKDKLVTDEDINRSMWLALVDLPRNRFYQANFSELNPVLCIAIQNWIVANRFENEGGQHEKTIAFIIRSSYVDLVIHTATLCGGFDHGQKIAIEARSLWHDEKLDGYLVNLDKQFNDARELKGRT